MVALISQFIKVFGPLFEVYKHERWYWMVSCISTVVGFWLMIQLGGSICFCSLW